ncbi:MAG: efflux RND transporter periplasmic adaptor subunit [Acidobacteria bacterium]|nr:efflux RND transporter periplasmic adaptor subunit [Acidobacteriota bacterium]
MKLDKFLLISLTALPLGAQTRLPGEILPYQKVALHARVTGFVERVEVDRGSVVKQGQTLAALAAPEMTAQLAEAEAKAQAVDAQRAEAQAKIVAAQATYDRLKAASATSGAVSGQELDLAEKTLAAARAAEKSFADSARAAGEAIRKLEAYLQITAPFDGVITARYVHPGALAGPASGPLLELEQIQRLRVVIAVPESGLAGIASGARIGFTVPAWPGRTFSGVVARQAHALDPKTRTMPVELDVANPQGALAPGMYVEAQWPAPATKAAK